MKKLITLIILFTFLQGCQTTEEPLDLSMTLDIYYLNDLHGAILEEGPSMGMSKIGNFLLDEQANNDSMMILSGGDMLQGTLISNYFYGESTMALLDGVNLDAAVIGNHEFDWGLEKVTRYYDGTHDYKADHPLLGANVLETRTASLPSGIDPYVIIERKDLKIGVIGTIGAGLESSILASAVDGYQFLNPVPIIKDTAHYLRTEENVHVVLLLTHDTGLSLNDQVLAFEGDYKIDAIFNGHSHRLEEANIQGVPVIQSGANGAYIGHVQLEIEEGFITGSSVRNIDQSMDARLFEESQVINDLLEPYYLEVSDYYEVLTHTTHFHTRDMLTSYMSELMLAATNADFAFHNSGGTRRFIDNNTMMTKSTMQDVFPFDNQLITVALPAYKVNDLINSNPFYASQVETVESGKTYLVATHDYLFSHPRNQLDRFDDITYYDTVIYDLAFEDLVLKSELFNRFSVYDEVLITHALIEDTVISP